VARRETIRGADDTALNNDFLTLAYQAIDD